MSKILNFFKENKNIIFDFLHLIFILLFALGILIYIFDKYGEKNYQQILDLLKIILSWPVLSFTFLFLFTNSYSDSIKSFLSTHKIGNVPGIGEKEQEINNVLNVEENENTRIINPTLFNNNTSSNEGNELINTLKEKIEFYEFSYLSLFFVEQTKNVLLWFFNSKGGHPITKESFHTMWIPFISEYNNRETIFNVLVHYGMLNGITGGAYSISEKGENFLKYINFINK